MGIIKKMDDKKESAKVYAKQLNVTDSNRSVYEALTQVAQQQDASDTPKVIVEDVKVDNVEVKGEKVIGTVTIDSPDYIKETALKFGTKPSTPSSKEDEYHTVKRRELGPEQLRSIDDLKAYGKDRDMLCKFLTDHGIDETAADDIMKNLAEWRGMINYLSRRQIIISGETWLGCKCGEIYYLPDKECYALVVGVIAHDKHMNGDSWVATRTSTMGKPSKVDAWMNLNSEPDDDSILFVRPDTQIRFGLGFIYNIIGHKIGKYLSGEPVYTMTDEEWQKAYATLNEYESRQLGER